ncbi:MAG: hypothetical protein SFW67_11915 [Myxococcaceae bacterium]|nr:hypothetical protein [Myxococcaceae bacterium]
MRVLAATILSVVLGQAAVPPLGSPPLEFDAGELARLEFAPARDEVAVAVTPQLIVVLWVDGRTSVTGIDREDLAGVAVDRQTLEVLARFRGESPPGTGARTPSLAIGNNGSSLGWFQDVTNAQLTGLDAGRFGVFAVTGPGLNETSGPIPGDGASVPRVAAFGVTHLAALRLGPALVVSTSVDGGRWTTTVPAPGRPIQGEVRVARVGANLIIAATQSDGGIVSGTPDEWAAQTGLRLDRTGTLVDLVESGTGRRVLITSDGSGTMFADGQLEVLTPERVDLVASFPGGVLASSGGAKPLLIRVEGARDSRSMWVGERIIGLAGDGTGAVAVERGGRGLSLRPIGSRADGGLAVAPTSTLVTTALRAQVGPSVAWHEATQQFVVVWDEQDTPTTWRTGSAAVRLDGTTVDLRSTVGVTPTTGRPFSSLAASAHADGTLLLGRTDSTAWTLTELGPDLRPGRVIASQARGGWQAVAGAKAVLAWRTAPNAFIGRFADGGVVSLVSDGVRCVAAVGTDHVVPYWEAGRLMLSFLEPSSIRKTLPIPVTPPANDLCATPLDDTAGVVTWADRASIRQLVFTNDGGGTAWKLLPAIQATPQPIAPITVPVPGGLAVFWSAGGQGIGAQFVPADGGAGFDGALREDAGFVGEPAVAVSSQGSVLVAWHELDREEDTLRVRARLLVQSTPAQPVDGGVDAGRLDGGTNPDAGTLDAGPALPRVDGRLAEVQFIANGCGCTAGSGAATLGLLLLLSRWTRRRAR